MSGFQYFQMRSLRHGFKRAQREGPGATVPQQDRRLIYQTYHSLFKQAQLPYSAIYLVYSKMRLVTTR